MSKNWEAELSHAPKPQLPTDGMSDAESWEYLRSLKPEPQHEPRPQEKPTNTHDFGDSRAMAEFYSNNPGHQQSPQNDENELSKQIQAHQNAIKKRDEEIALRKKQEEQEQKKQQEQQEKLDYEKRIQTAYLYEMKNAKLRDYCLVKIGDKKQKQTVKHGVIWNIEKKWYGSKKYTVQCDDGTVVKVDTVYSLNQSGGRRRKSKKLCNKLKSRKSRRSSQSKSNNRRSRGSFCR
jgi:hypothetical protein